MLPSLTMVKYNPLVAALCQFKSGCFCIPLGPIYDCLKFSNNVGPIYDCLKFSNNVRVCSSVTLCLTRIGVVVCLLV